MDAKILIIVPAFNEEKNIEKLVKELNGMRDINLDVLIVNDCSTDNTQDVCYRSGVRTINLPCNLGIGGAVQTGYRFALTQKYDIAIQVDGDGQHKPEYIRELIKPLIMNEADMVIGSRYINKEGFQSTKLRRLGIVYFSRLLKLLTNQLITDPTSGFRACNSKVIQLFSGRYPVDYPEPESIMYLKRNHFRIKEIPVQMQARISGVSSIDSFKSVYYMTKVSMAILIDKMRKQIV